MWTNPINDEGELEGVSPGGAPYLSHRKPDAHCPLCALAGTPEAPYSHAERIWAEWDPKGRRRDWEGRVAGICEELLGERPTEREVKEHFSKHEIEQPELSGRLDRQGALAGAYELSETQRAVINGVFRQKVLTQAQIVEIFYRPEHTTQGAKSKARDELATLAQAHYLFRFKPGAREKALRGARGISRFGKSNLWLLGRAAAPYISDRYSMTEDPTYAKNARELPRDTLIHDLQAAEIVASLCGAVNEAGEISTRAGALRVGLVRENWYGPGPATLALGFSDGRGGRSQLRPDGFASLSALWSDRSGELSDGQLPFYYEFDHSSKTVDEVARQLMAYHTLGLSGAALRRWPDLRPASASDDDLGASYAIPVVFVFSGASQKRMENILRAFNEMRIAQHNGEPPGGRIFVTTEKAWKKDPLSVGVEAWGEERREWPLLDFLIDCSAPLLREGRVGPDQPLQLDSKAASVLGDAGATAISHAHAKARENREARAAEPPVESAPEPPAPEPPVESAPEPPAPEPPASQSVSLEGQDEGAPRPTSEESEGELRSVAFEGASEPAPAPADEQVSGDLETEIAAAERRLRELRELAQQRTAGTDPQQEVASPSYEETSRATPDELSPDPPAREAEPLESEQQSSEPELLVAPTAPAEPELLTPPPEPDPILPSTEETAEPAAPTDVPAVEESDEAPTPPPAPAPQHPAEAPTPPPAPAPQHPAEDPTPQSFLPMEESAPESEAPPTGEGELPYLPGADLGRSAEMEQPPSQSQPAASEGLGEFLPAPEPEPQPSSQEPTGFLPHAGDYEESASQAAAGPAAGADESLLPDVEVDPEAPHPPAAPLAEAEIDETLIEELTATEYVPEPPRQAAGADETFPVFPAGAKTPASPPPVAPAPAEPEAPLPPPLPTFSAPEDEPPPAPPELPRSPARDLDEAPPFSEPPQSEELSLPPLSQPASPIISTDEDELDELWTGDQSELPPLEIQSARPASPSPPPQTPEQLQPSMVEDALSDRAAAIRRRRRRRQSG